MNYKEIQNKESQVGVKNCNTNQITWFLDVAKAVNSLDSMKRSASLIGVDVKFKLVRREAFIKTVKTITYGTVRDF